MPRINEIQIIRGLEANLPVGGELEGELRYASDTKRLYIDDGTNNILLGTNEAVTDMNIAVKTEFSKKQTVFTGICQEQYLTENDITIDCTGVAPKLTIATVKDGTTISASNPICFYTDGSGIATKHTINTSVSVSFTYTTGVWYFYFNSAGQLLATQTPWTDFSTIATVYRLYINDTLTGQERNVVESIEFHKNDISWTDHMWKHAQGTIWANGGDVVSNILPISGTGVPTISPNTNGSNSVISLSSLTNEDDNMPYTVTNSLNTLLKFNQDLGILLAGSLTSSNSGLFKVRTNDANNRLLFLPATRFPFPWNTVTNRPEYITVNGTRTLVADNRWFVVYLYALQDPRNGETVKVVPEITDFTSYVNAQASNWEGLKAVYPTIRDNEIRPLYKLIYYCDSSGGGAYSSLCKYSALVKIDDIRTTKVSSVSSASGTMLSPSIIVTPVGDIASTNVQSAIEELDLEKEPANVNIQTHIASTSNPHSVTQTQVGLSNVTNNAQVKKIASSTDNAIVRWDSTTGDMPQDSLATVDDAGSVNIPTGQNYNINGVALKDVSETLTNKTLTAPILNTEVTGTGVTTAGEANKLVKVNSSGKLGLSGATNPKSQIQIGNKANIFNGANIAGANWLDLGYNVHFDGGAYKYTLGTGALGDEAALLEVGAGGFGFYTAVAGSTDTTVSLTKRLEVTKDFIKAPVLSGTGSRAVVADATGKLNTTGMDSVFVVSSTTPTSTGININAGNQGRIIMAYISNQWQAGAGTASALVMINCGYDGDNFSATLISSTASYTTYNVIFSQVAGVLHVALNVSHGARIRFISN